MFSLEGKKAIVTGGTRGIGGAISRVLADQGADVVPTSRTESYVEATVKAVCERGWRSLVAPTDVTDRRAVEALFRAVDEELGSVEIVVNNAGINPKSGMGRPETVDLESFDRTIDVNLRGAFLCARAAADHLGEFGGTLINVASVSGLVGLLRQHPYVA
jgi:NAD(P)-dependent dehydrogenase (short-subunit alcohol dehydrogenase family)